MGGQGSGQWMRINTKRRTGDLLALNVNYLQREGYLQPGEYNLLAWTRNGKEISSISVNALSDDTIELGYNYRGESIEDLIRLSASRCNYGGVRQYFICPSCGKRVAILYGGKYFRCRRCYDLRYRTQIENPTHRLLTKRNKLADKIDAHNTLPLTCRCSKPKWMHWRTFYRHLNEWYELNAQSMEAISGYLAGIRSAISQIRK